MFFDLNGLIFCFTGNKGLPYLEQFQFKSGIGSCIAPKAGLARPPAKGMYSFLVFRRFRCPGPGSSWGNLAVLPASKDAENSNNMYVVSPTKYYLNVQRFELLPSPRRTSKSEEYKKIKTTIKDCGKSLAQYHAKHILRFQNCVQFVDFTKKKTKICDFPSFPPLTLRNAFI